jgi:hypothetical protein
MKAQHRHELETNVLAKELNAWREKLRPHSSAIATGLIVVLAVYALLSMWNSRSAGREQEAWFAFEKAMLQSDVGLTDVQRAAASDDFQGSRMQEWAYLAWADRQLRLAADMFFRNREEANDRLGRILSYYKNLAQGASDPEIQNRARLGLARVYEMQNDLEDAREQYAAVAGTLSAVAAERLKDLEDRADELEDATAWLATADVPAPAPGAGLEGFPGVRPRADVELPGAEGEPGVLGPAQSLGDIMSEALGEGGEGGRYGEGAEGAAPEEGMAPEEGAAVEEGAAAEEPAAETPAAEEPATAEPEAEEPAAGEEPAAQP